MVRLFTKNRFWRFESAYFTCALLVTYFAGVIHRIIAKPRVIRSKGNFSGKRGGNFYFEKFQVMTEICRKISSYAGQEFHLMPELSL